VAQVSEAEIVIENRGIFERLDRRFADAEDAACDAWKGASQAAAVHAIETWTSGGLGARVAVLYGIAQ
jgi:hypothetical protein